LSDEDLSLIARALPVGWAHGNRYSLNQSKAVEQYC